MKRKLMVLALIVLCLSIAAVGSAAYFTAEGTATNVITAGNIDVKLIETAVSDDGTEAPFEDAVGVMPGTEASKVVKVENTGGNAAYVRIKVEITVTAADGETALDPKPVSMSIDTSKWEYKDGWFYYKDPLTAGATTSPLFEAVTFSKDMGNDYQNATAVIDVAVQATQVANNGASAITASGWPAA